MSMCSLRYYWSKPHRGFARKELTLYIDHLRIVFPHLRSVLRTASCLHIFDALLPWPFGREKCPPFLDCIEAEMYLCLQREC
jgi:hypothetical protein